MKLSAILVAIFVAAGCASSTPGSAESTGVPSPEAVASQPSESPGAMPSAPLTIKEAAAAYLAVAKPYNATVKAADKKWGKSSALKAQKRYFAALAKAEDKFIDGLKLIAFPPEIQPDANALLKAVIVEQHRDLSASIAKSASAMLARVKEANKAAVIATDKAAILRDDLGLPPNP